MRDPKTIMDELVSSGLQPGQLSLVMELSMAVATASAGTVDRKPQTVGAARQARYRERHKASQIVTEVTRDVTSNDSNASVTPPQPAPSSLPCPSHTLPLPPSRSDQLDAGQPAEAGAKPLSSLDRLWIEGVPIMTSMGVAEKQCRGLIGKWLKACANVPLPVLDAIQRARDHRIVEPVAWITRSLAEISNHERNHQDRNGLSAAFDKLDARIAGRESSAPVYDRAELDLAAGKGLPGFVGRLV